MALTENYVEKIKKAKSEKKNIRTIKKSRKILFDFFDRQYTTKKSMKRFESFSLMNLK